MSERHKGDRFWFYGAHALIFAATILMAALFLMQVASEGGIWPRPHQALPPAAAK